MKKCIFLDFDGVITTLKSNWNLDKAKMEMVKRICDETGAKIVISSSWRRYTLADTIESITTNQIEKGQEPFLMPEYIVGITARMYSFKFGLREEHYKVCRGVEIDRWLWEHPQIVNYVILDDDSDMLLRQKNNFIKTHALRGISKRDVEKAIKILNNEK